MDIKINPNLDNFIKLAKKNNLIVLSYKFYSDWFTPIAAYYNLRDKIKGDSFLLESVEGQEKVCRYSFLGFCPLAVFKTKQDKAYLKNGQKLKKFKINKDPLVELKKIMSGYKVAPKENLRFFGGFVGYFGYDLVRFYEPVGKELEDKISTFDSYLVLPKYLIIFDHLKKQIEILNFVSLDKKNNLRELYKKGCGKILKLYGQMIKIKPLPELNFTKKTVRMSSNFKKAKFIKSVEKAKKHIREGDIIQTVLSQRFRCNFSKDPFLAYRYLRILNPSPYMFYLNFGKMKLAGSSPEMLLRAEKDELITHPIAGTRPRGRDEAEDQRLKKSLLSDQKERAEHIMLVDLARNDLGRVAKKTTVNLPVFMNVEKFSHVMHIVSEVRAKIKKGQTLFSALKSCFPAGTVSGAPKVRAMQIINELEPDRRGVYAGSVGYFSFTNSLDTCIIIRTILFKDSSAYIQAGAGIVADSLPESEYEETINKAKAQVKALELAEGN
ncbi:MAG: anthranilate synthase component I [Candidatus Omnitrophica bacterium]|nr:anthranilate synthase component I [Candidatus Omnitrophota bacterium]MCF7877654.1 anthranilate synthase component I [Candidatus Omnitrophota bacterium]MCF7892287.1 anthranilate synthase component I [Candidatus Omnitrophota bacterium]MCF7897964.1 anthranilate synthase component I [Candidatus Omnitrophota bacterium]MCF7909992.1 anthranilate synthase component I [Candidatus Omnitrophota bacterium]